MTPGNVITLSAIGLDAPGLVAKITRKVFDLGGNVIDVEENCRRGLFSIFLIVDFSASTVPHDRIEAALHALEGETGLKVVVAAYDEAAIPAGGSKEHHVVTILGIDKPGIIAKVSSFFHQRNVNIETCTMIARGAFFSMEVLVDTVGMPAGAGRRDAAIDQMKHELKELCAGLDQSVVVQSEDVFKKIKKLVVFDVDSTLMDTSSVAAFLAKLGLQVDGVSLGKILDSAGGTSIDALLANASALKGIPACEFEQLTSVLELTPGAAELIGILKSMGFKIALLSSGFNVFIKRVFEKAGIDYAFSNTLKVGPDGRLTGELVDPVITNDTKNEILEFIMNVEGITREQVIAVGDGSTNAHFMKNVGLSIAFKPSDTATTESDGVLASDRIKDLLFCMGIPRPDLDKATRDRAD